MSPWPGVGRSHVGGGAGTSTRPPAELQLRLRDFVAHEAPARGSPGARNQVFVGAVVTDSSSVRVGPDGKPVVDLVTPPPVGPAEELRHRWRDEAHVLARFDLRQPGDWPRAYTVTLLVVQHENGELAQAFDRLEAHIGGKIRETVASAATAAGDLAGAPSASMIPGIGTAVGAAVRALAGEAYDGIIAEIGTGLGGEVFTPVPLVLTIDEPWPAPAAVGADHRQSIRGHGAHYELLYDWHVIP